MSLFEMIIVLLFAVPAVASVFAAVAVYMAALHTQRNAGAMDSMPQRKGKAEIKPDKYDDIMHNIEVYDGTGRGQREVSK